MPFILWRIKDPGLLLTSPKRPEQPLATPPSVGPPEATSQAQNPLPAPAYLPGPALPPLLCSLSLKMRVYQAPWSHSFHQDQDSRKIHPSHRPRLFSVFSHHMDSDTNRLHRDWGSSCGQNTQQCLVQGKPRPGYPSPPPHSCPRPMGAAKVQHSLGCPCCPIPSLDPRPGPPGRVICLI